MSKQLTVKSQVTDEEVKLPPREKSLSVRTFPDDPMRVPEFAFVGSWTGRDVQLLPRLLARAYRLHQANIRRGGI